MCLLDTHTTGTRPNDTQLIKTTCVFLPSPLSFRDIILLSGSRGDIRLPLHYSEEPLMRERQMCLYCKQERGDGEWCRAMPRDPVSARGGCLDRLHEEIWTGAMLCLNAQQYLLSFFASC